MREHRTDGARRLRQAGIWLMVGATGTAFGVPVAIASVGTAEGPRGWRGYCSGSA
ncbi:hypothetical protein [Streptomyces sp. GESEQ-35]|uniref:hypothetical protein n=1 Tax=Streptomyces sp. GESEQ-35 TaxID=2812657 RepID=UPI001FF35877|nr:hypothetical protein [Streptomyces sp. GESEQ-35]